MSPSASPSQSPVERLLLDARSLPMFQHPSRELLEEHGFVQHKYHKFRSKCLKGAIRELARSELLPLPLH